MSLFGFGSDKKRLLVVDDDPMTRSVLVDTLEETYALDQAETGREAVEKVKKNVYDLILLDWRMPGLSGLETLGLIRMEVNGGRVPIIMVTGERMTGRVMEAFEKGVVDYIIKPFDVNSIRSKVEKALAAAPPKQP